MSSTATYRITRISVRKTAVVLMLLGAVLGVPVGFFTQIPRWLREAPGLTLLVVPAAYAIGGLVTGLLGAALYNLLAPRIGGIEWTVRIS